MTSMKKRIATTLTAATLTIGLTIPATAADMFGESIRVSSYKGTTLKVGERSGSHHRPQRYGLHRHLQ